MANHKAEIPVHDYIYVFIDNTGTQLNLIYIYRQTPQRWRHHTIQPQAQLECVPFASYPNICILIESGAWLKSAHLSFSSWPKYLEVSIILVHFGCHGEQKHRMFCA